MRRRLAALALGVAAAIVSFTLDQLAKARWLASSESPAGFWYLRGWVQSIDHHNHGITFNLPLPNVITLFITLIALAWVARESYRAYIRQDVRALFFLGLIVGGALGNAYDRAMFNYVRDWLLLWFRSAVNLADISILVGALGYLWVRWTEKTKQEISS